MSAVLAAARPIAAGEHGLDDVAWLMERAADAAVLTEPSGVIRYVNPAFQRLTGYASDEAIGRTPSILKSGRQSPAYYERMWRTLRAGREFCDVIVNRRKDGALFHDEKTIRPLFDAAGRISWFLSHGHDVSARVGEMDRLAHAATHDGATGLPNRGLLLDRLEQACSRARRSGGPFVVALLDVDRFKAINDSLGHAVGDAVLVEVARRLRGTVRRTDTVARLGGDEFALLLAVAREAASATHVLRKLVEAFATPIQVGAHRLAVGISVGAVLCDGHDEPGTALDKADAAMYVAKRSGGGTFRLAPARQRALFEAADGDSDTMPLGEPLPEVLRLLRRHLPLQRREFAAGEAVYAAGDRLQQLYLLQSGAVKLRQRGDAGAPVVALRFHGQWLGLDGVPGGRHTADAVAVEPSVAWALRYQDLLHSPCPQPIALLRAAMHQAVDLECAMQRSHEAAPARARVAQFLCEAAAAQGLHDAADGPLVLGLTAAELGGYLGLSAAAFERVLARLADEKVIGFDASAQMRVHIVDAAALAACALQR
ncbi:MAG: diguanylate cyclase [Burkholderiaceae bacterium]